MLWIAEEKQIKSEVRGLAYENIQYYRVTILLLTS